MFGQMTAGSWIYIGTQGILQGTYQTFAAAAEKHFGADDLAGRTVLTAGLGGMGGAQPLAASMLGRRDALRRGRSGPDRAAARDAVPRRGDRLARRRACAGAGRGSASAAALSVGLLGNAAEVVPELARRGEHFDLVTDQTAAHDPLTGYVPVGLVGRGRGRDCARPIRTSTCAARVSRSPSTSAACSTTSAPGSYVFDYGNNLRGEAVAAGVEDAFTYPGFVPAYIRPLFCRGNGPFRWAALSGDPADIAAIDDELRRLFPGRRDPAAVARAGARAGRVPGAAGADLLARLRRPCPRRPRHQRARPLGTRAGAGRDRPRPPRLRLSRLAVPRDRGDARRLGRDRRLADPERAPEHGGRARPGSASTTAAGSGSATRSTPAWSSSPTGRTTPPSGSSAC